MNEQQARDLGAYIQKHRVAQNISIRALAGAVSVDAAQIMRLEHGTVSSPKADLLVRIADRLALPLADVFILAGYTTPRELPSFKPYLRTKYHNLPLSALAELDAVFADIARRYGATRGPTAGEDEQ